MQQDFEDSGRSATRLDEVIAEYMRAVDKQGKIDREAFLARYPELEGPLRQHFEDIDALGQFVLGAESSQATEEREEPPDNEPSPKGLKTIAGFEIIEVLGEGTFGTVYRARDRELGREVALKTPRAGMLLTAEEKSRFVAEGKIAARLRHSGIIPVFEVGQEDGLLYIVTEYVEGMTLRELLQERKLTSRETANIVLQVAIALEYAHRNGVVHRDLKPSNIMVETVETEELLGGVSESDTPGSSTQWLLRAYSSSSTSAATPKTLVPRIMDFGLARHLDSEVSLTVDGQILGTPAYMSPEQARGDARGVDGRSDVFSLGVILYRLLCNELPFRGSARMVLQQVLQEDARPPRQLDETIPRDLETITLRCLEKDPSRRYATAGDVAAELRRFLDRRPILARPISKRERAWKWYCRNPGLAHGLVFGVLALSLGMVASFIGYMKTRGAEAEARENLEYADSTVDYFLLNVANKDLLSLEGAQPIRLSLFQRAIDYYRKLEQRRDVPLAMRLKGAETLYHLAELAHDLALNEKAREALDTSIATLEQIAAHYPEDPEVLRRLGEAYTEDGSYWQNEETYDRAVGPFEAAIRVRRSLVRQRPDDPHYRRQLAGALMNLSINRMRVAEREPDPATRRELAAEPQEILEEVQSIRLDLLELDPNDAVTRYELGMGYYTMANFGDLCQRADRSELMKLIRKAEAAFAELLRDRPAGVNLIETRYQRAICGALSARIHLTGRDHLTRGDRITALGDCNAAIENLDELIASNPAVTKYVETWTLVHLLAGKAALAHPERVRHFETVEAKLQPLVEQEQKIGPYHDLLASALSEWSLIVEETWCNEEITTTKAITLVRRNRDKLQEINEGETFRNEITEAERILENLCKYEEQEASSNAPAVTL